MLAAGFETTSLIWLNMLLQGLQATPALELVEFPTLDEFIAFEGFGQARNTPTSGCCGSARAHVDLPNCLLTIQQTFPRILEVNYQISGLLCVVPLLPSVNVTVNGLNGTSFRLMAVRGNASCEIFEPAANLFAIIKLAPSASQRGWPAIDDHSIGFFDVVNVEALQSFRDTVAYVLSLVSRQSTPVRTDVLLSFEERLLSTLCEALRSSARVALPNQSEKYRLIVRRMDQFLGYHQAQDIYLAEVAHACGTSLRTLQKATRTVRGMSASRYLRLRRLWLVRQRLASGQASMKVSDIARSHGFRHMGEFSAAYRSTFGESPSDTIVRSRSSGFRKQWGPRPPRKHSQRRLTSK